MAIASVHHHTRFTETDIFLFMEGSHYRLYDKFGAHPCTVDDVPGTSFAVWAPNAREVSVLGDFNSWTPGVHTLFPRWDHSGVWEGFIPGVERGTLYKFHIRSTRDDYQVQKSDPYALFTESPPSTASIVWDTQYEWGDGEWMSGRERRSALDSPLTVLEIHLGSWRRVFEEHNRSLSYLELAESLPDYVAGLGFTHVELLPVMEHPFFGSWGYQVTGYFAPSSRYGTPQEFMALVDAFHRRSIGVILDWVPSHFPTDEHGLVFFDGTHLYEHADPRQGFHPDWNSAIFNYGRHEVRSFLISSALFWLEHYHADALRVDAVASMLYLDYSRKEGEWVPNKYGRRENLEALEFIKALNSAVYGHHPGVQTIAEESTAWPMVSRPVHLGGLGFGLKWNMGWMHDTLAYFSKDPVHRKYHANQLTFGIWYAFHENFVLPLSHDEVVHGKGSLLDKMPGDVWQKFANLRLLYGFMWAHPGKKLLFMGGEFGQWSEWRHDSALEWSLLDGELHKGVMRWIKDLNEGLRSTSALYRLDFDSAGFSWVDCTDHEASVFSFLRRDDEEGLVLVVVNATPIPREGYRIGVPQQGRWREMLNSDGVEYGGSGMGNMGMVVAEKRPEHGHPFSLSLTLPPLSVLYFEPSE